MAREWLGELQAFESFHWHGETFTIPPGATRMLENAHCANQAFALGKHLGMQCHVEMTAELVGLVRERRATRCEAQRAQPGGAAAGGDRSAISRPRIAALHEVADRLYDRWTQDLSRGSS